MRKSALAAAAAGTCLLGVAALGMGTALADPSGAPTYRTYVAVGSDTTESVMDGLANAITVSGNKVIGSYDASNGSATIQTRGGSLSAAQNAGDTTITLSSQLLGAIQGDPLTVAGDSVSLSSTAALPTASPWTYTLAAGLPSAHSIGDLVTDTRCTFTRPVGSGAGRSVLDSSINNTTWSGNGANTNTLGGCADIARNSSFSTSTVYGTAGSHELTAVPFGFDAVTFATLGTSSVPRQLTIGQLKAIYQCAYHAPGALQTILPLLPQSNSGTRQFFLQSIGLSSSALIPAAGSGGAVVEGTGSNLGSCVDSGSGPNQPTAETPGVGFTENQGTVLASSLQLVPFSAGQFIAQISGQQTNNLGRSALGAVSPSTATTPPTDARSALYINPTTSAQDPNAVYPMTREVFNTVSSARICNAAAGYTATASGSFLCTTPDQGLLNLLVGTNGPGTSNNSLVCSNLATIQKFGFDPAPDCGSTSRFSG